jgi:replication-associated recombination protein RarA
MTMKKYTPTNLNEIIYPNASTELRLKAIGNGSISAHVILYGPFGTAKSTTANLLAKAIGGPNAYIEANFSTLLDMPDLLFHIKQKCHFAKLATGSKCFLLFNEFDNFKGSPYKLWDAMDQIDPADLMLIITTNQLMTIHSSIRSRCRLIEFPAVTASAMLPRAQQILTSNGLALPDAQVLNYLKGEERFGDIRKYLALIEELLLIHKNGMNFPVWSGQKPSLKVAKP